MKKAHVVDKNDLMKLVIQETEAKRPCILLDDKKIKYIEEYEVHSKGVLPGAVTLIIKMQVKYP